MHLHFCTIYIYRNCMRLLKITLHMNKMKRIKMKDELQPDNVSISSDEILEHPAK
jgi:hypothetical protein